MPLYGDITVQGAPTAPAPYRQRSLPSLYQVLHLTEPSLHHPLQLIPTPLLQRQQDKMGDEVQALVVDNGSGMCKAGFAGDDAPR